MKVFLYRKMSVIKGGRNDGILQMAILPPQMT